MAILSNINDLFRVDSAGAVYFATSAGANLQVLQSVGAGGSPIWVDVDDIIGGPYLSLTGGTLSGPLAGTSATFSGTLTVGGATTLNSTLAGTSAIFTSDAGVTVYTVTSQAGAKITFSDEASSRSQKGFITYKHLDTASYGSTNSFIIDGDQATMTILADGKLMYKEGVYLKPATGTGAGTRKDNLWDAAYNDKITALAVAGTTTKTLTATQQDGGTLTASWTDNYENYDYWTLQGDSAANTNINSTNTLKFVGGTYIDTSATWAGGSNPRKLTINHETTSRTDTTSTDAPAFGGTFEAVTSVTTNTTGHVTAIDVSTITIPTDPGGTVTGTGANTQVAFWTGTSVIDGSSSLKWDNTNFRLGIGITPTYALDIYNSSGTTSSTTGTTLQRLWNYVGGDLQQQKTFIDFVFQDANDNEYPQVRIGAEVGQNGNADTQLKEGSGAFVVYTNNATTSVPGTNSLTERMRVDYAGNVGIGTVSPQQLLHINEALNTANPGIQVQGGSFGFTLNKAPQSADYVHLKPLGSGISVLRVMPNTSSSTSFIEAWGTDYEADTVNWNRLYMNVAGSSGNATITTDSNGTGAVGNLYLGTNSNQQTLTILDSGNVGIGETSPSEKLEVSGRIKIISTGSAHLILNGDTNNSGDAGEQDAIIDFLGDGDPGLYGFRINSENYGGQTAMNFQEYLNGSYSSRLYIDKVGNVGIGTTSPDAKLTVDSTTAPQLLLTNTGGGNSQILMYDNSRGTQNASITFDQTGENQLYITTGYDSPSDLNRIYFQPGGETAMTIRGGNNATGTAGNVGIGNTTPQTTLHVGTTTTVTNQFTNQVAASNFFVNGNANGGASFFQCKTAAVNINMMGNNDFACNQFTFYHKPLSTSQNVVGSITTFSSSTQYSTTSDYRLKENIIPLSDSITRLKQLKPSRFNFIEDPERTMDGFLAHEVQNIVPEAVNGEKDAIDENGNEVHQGIDQAKLVPLLVAAIQELEARVKELENK